MSCCWKPVSAQMNVISDSPLPRVGGDGVVPLASYPDCTQPHAGKHVLHIRASGTLTTAAQTITFDVKPDGTTSL